jgi:hypothetical protein
MALNHSALAARAAIAKNNEPSIRSFVSLNAFLLGAWAENCLCKLLYENNGLSVAERELVTSQPTHLNQWLKIIEGAL